MTRPAINPGKVDWSGREPRHVPERNRGRPVRHTHQLLPRGALTPRQGPRSRSCCRTRSGNGKDPGETQPVPDRQRHLWPAYLRDSFVAYFRCVQEALPALVEPPHRNPAWDFMAGG